MSSEALRSFAHGVHPDEHKEPTAHRPLERMPFVDRYVLPLSQHTGAPSKPTVAPGDRVRRGQVIGAPDGFVSTTLHSPVTGRVAAVTSHRHPNGSMVECLEIEADPWSTQLLDPGEPNDWRTLTLDQFVEQVQRAGLVGLGGAAFPTHVKYKLPEGRRCRRLVVNGCECEPYLTCDHRTMVERPESVVRGAEIVATKLGADETVFGVELNKPDGMDALNLCIPHGAPMRVLGLRVKYPQGAEKMLIKAVFDQEVPAGKLPIDIDIVVNNVGSMAALDDWFERGQPLIERPVTVAGPGVERPSNLVVPVGTSVREVLQH